MSQTEVLVSLQPSRLHCFLDAQMTPAPLWGSTHRGKRVASSNKTASLDMVI